MTRTNRTMVNIILIAWLAYLFSYLGRSDYNACLLEIINDTGISRALAGSISSSFAICNAIGQLISTMIITKFSPIKVINIELLAVAIINLLFPVTDSFAIMAILWGINGFLQSTLLCGITAIFVRTLKEPYLSRGACLLNTIGAVGGMFNYILSWFIIRHFNWKLVFICTSTLLFTLAVIWYIIIPKLTMSNYSFDSQPEKNASEKTKFRFTELFCSRATVFAIAASMFVGLLRESVSLWIPTYMNDVFKLTRDMSVIITAFVPCLQVCGALLGGFIGRRSKDLFLMSSVTFAISGLCLILIKIMENASITITLIMFIINAICMTAALTFMVSLYPIRYFDKKKVVFIVGLSNFFVHFGDFISATGIGWLSQNNGWMGTFAVLAFLAFFASALCLIGSNISNRKGHKNAEVRI